MELPGKPAAAANMHLDPCHDIPHPFPSHDIPSTSFVAVPLEHTKYNTPHDLSIIASHTYYIHCHRSHLISSRCKHIFCGLAWSGFLFSQANQSFPRVQYTWNPALQTGIFLHLDYHFAMGTGTATARARARICDAFHPKQLLSPSPSLPVSPSRRLHTHLTAQHEIYKRLFIANTVSGFKKYHRPK